MYKEYIKKYLSYRNRKKSFTGMKFLIKWRNMNFKFKLKPQKFHILEQNLEQ